MWVSDPPLSAPADAQKHKCESAKGCNYRIAHYPDTFSRAEMELNLKLLRDSAG